MAGVSARRVLAGAGDRAGSVRVELASRVDHPVSTLPYTSYTSYLICSPPESTTP